MHSSPSNPPVECTAVKGSPDMRQGDACKEVQTTTSPILIPRIRPTSTDDQPYSILSSLSDGQITKAISETIKAENVLVIWKNMSAVRNSVRRLAVCLRSRDQVKILGLKPAYYEDLQRMLWAFSETEINSSE